MSQTLHIEFSKDMPVAAVEVVAPDLRVVLRTVLSAGKFKDVDVPSDRSFLRVHLSDGRIVSLDDPGTLVRVISRASLRPRTTNSTGYEIVTHGSKSAPVGEANVGFSGRRRPSGEDVAEFRNTMPRVRADAVESRMSVTGVEPLRLRGGGEVRILGASAAIGRSLRGGAELLWRISMPRTGYPFQLRYASDAGPAVTVTLPASTISARVRREGKPNVNERLRVELQTKAEHADALLSYMSSGDMYAAQALAEWADDAETMVLRDDCDPYSGLVGAYLLLRLRQFDRMKDWVRQIADRFAFLSDGCIVWAWQQLHMSRGATPEAGKYLLEACARGLPVYSEGLRLLLDGLCLLGEAGEEEHDRMMKLASNIVWTSPVMTTYEFGKRESSRKLIAVDVTFASGR